MHAFQKGGWKRQHLVFRLSSMADDIIYDLCIGVFTLLRPSQCTPCSHNPADALFVTHVTFYKTYAADIVSPRPFMTP